MGGWRSSIGGLRVALARRDGAMAHGLPLSHAGGPLWQYRRRECNRNHRCRPFGEDLCRPKRRPAITSPAGQMESRGKRPIRLGLGVCTSADSAAGGFWASSRDRCGAVFAGVAQMVDPDDVARRQMEFTAEFAKYLPEHPEVDDFSDLHAWKAYAQSAGPFPAEFGAGLDGWRARFSSIADTMSSSVRWPNSASRSSV
jgi:hypothetical protein